VVEQTGILDPQGATLGQSEIRIDASRIIHIPLPGGDRKTQAKGVRQAHGLHNDQFRGSEPTRGAGKRSSFDCYR
jgi:hypothetical protein